MNSPNYINGMHWHDNPEPWPKRGFDLLVWWQWDATWHMIEDPDIWVVLTDPDLPQQSEIAWGYYDEAFDRALKKVKQHNNELMRTRLSSG